MILQNEFINAYRKNEEFRQERGNFVWGRRITGQKDNQPSEANPFLSVQRHSPKLDELSI